MSFVTVSSYVYSKSDPSINALRIQTPDQWEVVFSGGVGNCSAAGGFVEFNVWAHLVAIVRSDMSCAIYKDGELRATGSGSGGHDDSFGDLWIGIHSNLFARFDGIIDEFRVYNRELSPAEIKRLYKIGATLLVNKPSYTGLDNGLVRYWSFNGPDVAGTDPLVAYDRARSGHTATSSGSRIPRKVAGRIGQALSFDGVDDYLDADPSQSINTMSVISVSLWIKPDVIDGTTRVFVDKRWDGWKFGESSTASGMISLVIDGTTDPGDVWRATVANAIKVNEWQHVAVTWDGGTSYTGIHIYINGVEASYDSGQNGDGTRVDDSTNDLGIGGNVGLQNTLYSGLMDEVRIYDRALSPDEIRRLYNVGR